MSKINFPARAVILKNSSSPYTDTTYNQMLTLLYEIKDGYYLTDMFVSALKDTNDDFCYHGFMIVPESVATVL